MLDQAHLQTPAEIASERPLCVDMDGTLVKSDTLVDSLLLLARMKPLSFLKAFGWAVQGKARLKARVSALVSLDASRLPYNRPLLTYLQEEHARGRKIYLTTGADAALAKRIAAHLGIFTDVLASDGRINLTGKHKLESLQTVFPDTGFDYIGNANPDLPLLAHAGEAMLANPNSSLAARAKAQRITISRVFEDRPARIKSFLKAIRLHQWAKNVLIFVPMLLAHALEMHHLLNAALAFLSFSLCASATYIVNDLLDVEADRGHPKKRFRPFAAGDLQASTGVLIIAVFLAAALRISMILPHAFLGWILLYCLSTLSYSLILKRIVLVDVILLAGLYTLRMLAGGAATLVEISPWLAGLSVFLFFSLATVKRFSELQNMRERGHSPSNGRGYLLADIDQLRSFGTASAYAAAVVLALYISNGNVAQLYVHPVRMWLIVPLMLLWISRVWLLASRGEMNEDPVIFAVTDRMSLLIGAAVVAVAVSAAI